MVGLHQILADNVTHKYFVLGTTTKLSIPFQLSYGFLKEIFFIGLSLTVSDQKSTEARLKKH